MRFQDERPTEDIRELAKQARSMKIKNAQGIITDLTPLQQELLLLYRDEGLAVGNSTERIDFDKVKPLIEELYKFSDLKVPKDWYYVPSPKAAQKLIAELTGKKEFVSVSSYNTGSQESYWIWYYKYFKEVLGLEFEKKADDGLVLMEQIARSSGWYYMYDTCCIICDRPDQIHLNDRNEIHNESGPAIHFTEGFAIYAIDGHTIPAKLIEDPTSLTIDEIKNEQNAETKRIMMTIYGVSEYLVAIGAKVLDVDMGLGLDGSAMRTLLQDDVGQKWLVGSDGSTKRIYHMAVPNEVKTCREAHAQIAGFDETRLIAEA